MTPLLTLTIRMRATSINKWSRMHWRERRTDRAIAWLLVRESFPPEVINRHGWPAQEPVSLRITATMKPPILDADNVTLKDVVDSLKGWVIVDDDHRYVTQVTPLVKKGTEDFITVEVWGL